MLSGGLWMGPPRPIGPIKGVLVCGGGDEEAPLWSSGWGPPFISPELDEYPKERQLMVKGAQEEQTVKYQIKQHY